MLMFPLSMNAVETKKQDHATSSRIPSNREQSLYLPLVYLVSFIAVHAVLCYVQHGTIEDRVTELMNKTYGGAPIEPPDLTKGHYAGIPIILMTVLALHALLKSKYCAIPTVFIITYHCYILLDHVAVFWTTELFDTAEFHFKHLSILFWIMEASSGALAFANGAHWYVLLNIPNHLFFCRAYFLENTSQYFEWGFKPWWLNVAVMHDVIIHMLCLYAYLRRYLGRYAHHSTIALTAAMTIGTFLFHKDKVHLAHILIHTVHEIAPLNATQFGSTVYMALD